MAAGSVYTSLRVLIIAVIWAPSSHADIYLQTPNFGCLHPKLRSTHDMSVATKDEFRNGRQNMLKGGICYVYAFARAQWALEISAGTSPPPNVSVDAMSRTKVTTKRQFSLSRLNSG